MIPITGESFLLTLASIGLGFAGFSSLILTLRQSPTDKWLPREVAGLRFILEHSFGMLLFSLIPPLLLYSGVWIEQNVWRISNILLGIFLGLIVTSQIVKLSRVRQKKDKPAYPKQLLIFYIIPTCILCLVEMYKVRYGSIFWYGFGLIYILIQAAVQFWIFLVLYTRPAA
jgi:hypothetical protein